MPEISRFLGIIIQMFIDDHNPPHFHAVYNEFEAEIIIYESHLLNGNLPPQILRKVLYWADLHRDELMQNWENLRAQKPIFKIKPLEGK